ncbi:MAG: hypothetical protein E7108_01785 [Bacteroidales bacterium]|nr:hypothetical protein [Bacteroidales bacterium]
MKKMKENAESPRMYVILTRGFVKDGDYVENDFYIENTNDCKLFTKEEAMQTLDEYAREDGVMRCEGADALMGANWRLYKIAKIDKEILRALSDSDYKPYNELAASIHFEAK